MGTCQCKYTYVDSLRNSKQVEWLHNRVLKCPSGHWLALFETQACHQRHSSKQVAIVSCIECDYAQCEECFYQKYQSWKSQIQKLTPLQSENLMKQLQKQIKGFLHSSKEYMDHHNLKRFVQFLQNQRQRLFHSKIVKQDALEARVRKITLMCEDVYKRKAYSAITV